jgi:cellulose biosynthesis protein BcsQ
LLQAHKTIEEFKDINPNLKILGYLPSMYDPRVSLHRNELDDTVAFCLEHELPLMDVYIKLAILFSDTLSYHKKPLTLQYPESKYSKEIKDLWDEIAIRAGGYR